ncbi:hypothetical protein ACEPAH_7373 [Sanghuangporus vaninii]
MAPKSSLSIRLTESVVFLRGSAETTVTGRRTTRDAPPAMLRGLLTLSLDKPTKISSIEITLEGKSVVTWPEGAGARKLEVTEEHDIFSATTVFFRAGKVQMDMGRRTASVGPGLAFDHDEIEEEAVSNEETSYQSHFSGSPTFPTQRRRVSMDYQFMRRAFSNDLPTPPYSPPNTRPGSLRTHESSQSITMAAPQMAQRTSPWVSNRSNISGTREENEVPHLSRESSEPQSSSSSIAEDSLSRRASNEDQDQPLDARSISRGRARSPVLRPSDTPTASRTPSVSTAPTSPLVVSHRPPSHTSSRQSAGNSTTTSANNSLSILPSQSRDLDGEARILSPSPQRERGRRHARFSLAMVSNALLDAVKERVRSNSRPREGKERATTPTASRDHSPEGSRTNRPPYGVTEHIIDSEDERGRRRSREEDFGKHKEKEKSTLGRITDALGLSTEPGEGDSWKEFRKGTYTYPISFAIPGDSPPSLECDFGTVKYRLKAVVHRPGAFTHRLNATREVTLIASPGEDDVDETDNIVVQREWDSQMHYLIIISGRSFPIGSSIPIHITFMPIAKIKIFRISALVEEKITYYTQFKQVARAEAVKKFELLSCRYHEKDGPPILPLASDFTSSPLRGLVDAEDESEAASSLMGPGPWSIQALLQLPKSCSLMHFTNKHKRSNIGIAHVLKIVFRVERGDDQFIDTKTGRRKHFDIVVQTPLHILSCRCNPEWTSLPRYSRLELGSYPGTQNCPCTQRKDEAEGTETAILPPVTTGPIASSSTSHYSPFHTFFHTFDYNEAPSAMEEQTSPGSVYSGGQSLSRLSSEVPADLASLYRRNTQFARLVAGEESEAGEPPPQYDAVASLENACGAQTFATAIPADT